MTDSERATRDRAGLAPDADVIIVGAGLAGATAALVLARLGIRVTLVDRRTTCPPCFKAEKIEPDQVELFRKFGLMDDLLPRTGSISEVHRAAGGRVLRTSAIEQYGILYHDMVNAVRAVLPASVNLRIGRVDRVCTSNATQRVGLADGDELTARLVVLAGGTGGDLATRLGAVRCMVGPEHSMAFGFTIERRDGSPFGFDAVTYYPGGHTSRLAFLTLFRVGSAMRANLFAYWPNRGEPTRTFVREPVRELQRLMPGLTAVIGDVALVGRVESSRVDLYRTDRVPQEGIVLLADAFQSVCPTTGTGLSKVLTDVDVLCHDCVPQWLATPGMGADKIASYYRNPRKQDVDRRSLGGALYTKRMWTDPSLPWRLRRLRWWCENQVAGWRQSLKFTRKLTA